MSFLKKSDRRYAKLPAEELDQACQELEDAERHTKELLAEVENAKAFKVLLAIERVKRILTNL